MVSLDETLVQTLRENWRQAELDAPDHAMLAYVEKLTLQPAAISRQDLDALRHVGFDDKAILQINLIASWFNYINRVADGLGVGRE